MENQRKEILYAEHGAWNCETNTEFWRGNLEGDYLKDV
jgi:hypothetical protein